MRVAIVTPWFPNKRDGWPARFVSDSAIALANAEARVSVSVIRGWAPAGLEQFASPEHRGTINRREFPEIERLDTKRYLTVPGNWARPFTNLSLDRAAERFLEANVVALGANLVHAHTETLAPAAARVASRHRLPLVVTLHGENTNSRYLGSPGQKRRFSDALSAARRLVVVGDPLRDYAEGLAGRGDHIVTVWNGIMPPARKRQFDAPDTKPLAIICVANLLESKGVDILVEALARLKPEPGSGLEEWHLTVIGDGVQRASLELQAKNSGLIDRVTFVGRMPNGEVLEHLMEADIFALPSYREAFGVAYAEAMASGLLTIGVEDQGPSQFIEHEKTGLLIKPRDVASLEAALRRLLSDPSRQWRSIATAGAHHVRRTCTWDAHAKKLLNVFEDARSEHGTATS